MQEGFGNDPTGQAGYKPPVLSQKTDMVAFILFYLFQSLVCVDPCGDASQCSCNGCVSEEEPTCLVADGFVDGTLAAGRAPAGRALGGRLPGGRTREEEVKRETSVGFGGGQKVKVCGSV